MTLRAPSREIPPRQAAVLEFIKDKTANGGRFPRLSEIADHLGWQNENSARDCLERLVWRGLLKRTTVGPTERSPSRRYRWELA